MNKNLTQSICDQLIGQRPPRDIGTLVSISNIDWKEVSTDDIDNCCEIILKITADAICIKYEKSAENKYLYFDVLNKIRGNVIKSNINLKSIDFSECFEKFCSYLDDV